MEKKELLEALAQATKDGTIKKLLAEVEKQIAGEKVLALTIKDDALQSPGEGWKLISDSGKKLVGTITLELVPILKEGEPNLPGVELIKRARELGADLGQHYAEAILANQHLIPKEWREFYLVFPGTVWQGPYDGRRVPYLYWGGRRWVLGFDWLECGWGVRSRLLRLRK